MDKDGIRVGLTIITVGLVIIIGVIALCMWGLPKYKVYTRTMSGKAALMQAEQEKQILIEQAKAEVESAKLRAEAIELVGKAAKEYPEYRQQEFIGAFAEAMQEGNIDQIIYVPTESNIPIIENRQRD